MLFYYIYYTYMNTENARVGGRQVTPATVPDYTEKQVKDPTTITMEDICDISNVVGGYQRITEDALVELNTIEDKTFIQGFRENLLTYRTVLSGTTATLPEYISAVRFVTYLNTGDTKVEAYYKVFPDRVESMQLKYLDRPDTLAKTIKQRASMFVRTVLVTKLIDQATIPAHLLYPDVAYEAVDKAVDIMRHSKSDKNALEASMFLWETLRPPPEVSEVEVKATSLIDELKKFSEQSAQEQLDKINAKVITVMDVRDTPVLPEGVFDEQQ
jgi:hypothetical protein